jgi:hypothetical protein
MSFYRQIANVPTYANALTMNVVNVALIPLGSLPLNMTSFISNGFASTLIITSAGNASATVLTILGTYNGNLVTESITGPNAGNVNSINFYDTIISITSSAVLAANLQIGGGNNAVVRLNSYNFQNNITKPNNNFSFFVSNLTAAGLPGIQLFGVTNTAPQSLQVANFVLGTRPANFQLLTPALTQVQVNAGYSFTTTYPYATVIASLISVATPTYVEIIQ